MNFQCKLTLMPLAFTQITRVVPTLTLTYLHKLLMLSLLVHHHEWHFCKTIATQKESSNAFIIHLSNKPDMYFANTTCIPFVESTNVDVCILISKYKKQEMYRPKIIYFIENRFPFSDRIEWIEKLYLPLNNWAQAFVYIFFSI